VGAEPADQGPLAHLRLGDEGAGLDRVDEVNVQPGHVIGHNQGGGGEGGLRGFQADAQNGQQAAGPALFQGQAPGQGQPGIDQGHGGRALGQMQPQERQAQPASQADGGGGSRHGLALTPQEVLGVALVDAGHGHEHGQVGGVEIRIPGRFAANPGPGPEVALDQGRGFRRTVLVQGRQRQGAAGEDPVFQGAHVGLQAMVEGGGAMAPVRHAYGSAAHQIFIAVFQHVAGQSGPQQGNGGAAAVIWMDAGAADFHQLGT